MNLLDSQAIHIPRKYLFISIAVLFLLGVLVAVKMVVYPVPQKSVVYASEPEETLTSITPLTEGGVVILPFVLSTSTILTPVEYAKVQTYVLDLVKKESPTVALTQLKVLMKENASVSRSCHGIVHEIGHETYRKYNDFAAAMAYREDICGSGFLHGVIETHFAKVDNVFKEMDTICNTYSTLNDKAKCYHGVGHGIMFYTENDLPVSIEHCDRYPDQEAKVRCAEGVFMENFNTEQKDHLSVYLDNVNPASICVNQPSLYKGTCYFYTPLHYLSLHVDAYEEALTWCLDQEPGYQAVCASGVGSRAIKQHITNPKYVEKVCASGTPAQFKACLDGMVSYYLVHVDSLSKAKEMCWTLKESSQQACEWSVMYREDFFPN